MSAGPIAHAHGFVLAGGSGTRFWPLSRELTPKQLLDIFGTESLVCQAIHRVSPLVPDDALSVLTSARFAGEIRTHLLSQPDELMHHVQVLAEPLARNTGPAVVLAAAYLERIDPDGIAIILPSDHVLEADEGWERTLRVAAELAREGWIVTLGLVPDHPETGYGYIRSGEPLPVPGMPDAVACAVERFLEKPSREVAERLIAEGGVYWNAGIFVFSAKAMMAEARRLLPEVAEAATRVAALPVTEWAAGADVFDSLPPVSIDVGVLEHSDKVAVVPAELRWRDVGSFLALADLGETDERGNTMVGRVLDVDSRGSIVYAPERLVATLGLKDVVVVDTPDATLIADKDRVQDVRLITERLRQSGAEEALVHRDQRRPWGGWRELVASHSGYRIKVVEVAPGKRLSRQYHEHRSEHWVVVEGTALVERDGQEMTLGVNESTFIPKRVVHRVANAGDVPLLFIEVQVGDILEESDIVRLEDDWQREERPS